MEFIGLVYMGKIYMVYIYIYKRSGQLSQRFLYPFLRSSKLQRKRSYHKYFIKLIKNNKKEKILFAYLLFLYRSYIYISNVAKFMWPGYTVLY